MDLEGKINVLELKNHQKNDYYFDDIKGDGWNDLLQSIRTSGVTNAITITQDKVIISGHQRVRACKVLGIEEVSYKMIEYTDEKKQIKDLIESNLKQRVVGNPNPVKLGRCFDFLRDYYGIQHGAKEFQGNQHIKEVSPNNSETPTTQPQLANTYNVSVDTMENYIKLSKAIPEVANLVETGKITKTTALALMKVLSPSEQEELISTLDVTKKYTQNQIQEYVDKLKEKENEIEELKSQTKEKEVIEKFIDEKVKIENEKLKREKQQLENSKSTLENILKTTESLKEKYKKDSEEYIKVRDKMVKIGYTSGCDIDIINASKSICELSEKIENYLQTELAPMKYKDFMFLLAENDILKQNFMNLLNCVYNWYLDMKNCIDLDGINIYENIIDMEVL